MYFEYFTIFFKKSIDKFKILLYYVFVIHCFKGGDVMQFLINLFLFSFIICSFIFLYSLYMFFYIIFFQNKQGSKLKIKKNINS